MIEESRIAKGRAIGTSVEEAYISNCNTTYHSKPLPTRSSMYLKRNCINKINNAIKKVSIKGPINEPIISL
jgi:hypothetical protein